HLEDLGADLFADDLELLDGRRAVNVAGDEERAVALFLKIAGELCRVGGLAAALEAAHQHDAGGLRGELNPGVAAAHEGGQLLVDDLDNLLGGGEAFEDL